MDDIDSMEKTHQCFFGYDVKFEIITVAMQASKDISDHSEWNLQLNTAKLKDITILVIGEKLPLDGNVEVNNVCSKSINFAKQTVVLLY